MTKRIIRYRGYKTSEPALQVPAKPFVDDLVPIVVPDEDATMHIRYSSLGWFVFDQDNQVRGVTRGLETALGIAELAIASQEITGYTIRTRTPDAHWQIMASHLPQTDRREYPSAQAQLRTAALNEVSQRVNDITEEYFGPTCARSGPVTVPVFDWAFIYSAFAVLVISSFLGLWFLLR